MYTPFKGTVQQKLTGVESGINQKAFLLHCIAGILFLLLLNRQRPVSTAVAYKFQGVPAANN